MATISREEVAHLARLARLAVTDDELDTFAGQLDVILQAVAQVGEVAAVDVPPTSHSVPLTNVLRDDGVVSAVEVASAHLDRIAAADPKVHAFLHVDRDGALDAARRVDAARARGD